MAKEVDESFLTKQEAVECRAISSRTASSFSYGELFRNGSVVLLVASIVSGICGLMLLAPTNGATISFVLCGASMVLVVLWGWIAPRSLRRKQAEEYLVTIGYADRVRSGVKPEVLTSDRADDNYVWKSKRQMQHEWYEGHSELGWRDREIGELYGIDVDTYISNVLENDKD